MEIPQLILYKGLFASQEKSWKSPLLEDMSTAIVLNTSIGRLGKSFLNEFTKGSQISKRPFSARELAFCCWCSRFVTASESTVTHITEEHCELAGLGLEVLEVVCNLPFVKGARDSP